MIDKQSEEKAAAANYIINFYNEVQQLTHYYVEYENLMLEIAEKYEGAEDKISPEEKEVIKQAWKLIRYYTNMSFIKYSSIMIKTNNKVDKDIEKLQKDLLGKYEVVRKDIKDYVLKLNAVLMNTIIKSLLETSSDVMNKIYGEDKPKNDK
jgi:hypothetical protein